MGSVPTAWGMGAMPLPPMPPPRPALMLTAAAVRPETQLDGGDGTAEP